MDIKVFDNAEELGQNSGTVAVSLIREAIGTNGQANIILATGTSQLATLKQIIASDIDWSKVVMFHLDEYIDLPVTHNASFRKYLQEQFLSKVNPLKAVYLVNGETDPSLECKRLGNLIADHPIDVALVGIGENGHLAFNDPPADFDTDEAYITVHLDEACRNQQLGEGWFASLEQVPVKAISMSVKQIMKSKHIVCSVPDTRKALAVKNSLEQNVSNIYPASILRTHSDCRMFLDNNSASMLSKQFNGQ